MGDFGRGIGFQTSDLIQSGDFTGLNWVQANQTADIPHCQFCALVNTEMEVGRAGPGPQAVLCGGPRAFCGPKSFWNPKFRATFLKFGATLPKFGRKSGFWPKKPQIFLEASPPDPNFAHEFPFLPQKSPKTRQKCLCWIVIWAGFSRAYKLT